jgi:hypothetical protein
VEISKKLEAMKSFYETEKQKFCKYISSRDLVRVYRYYYILSEAGKTSISWKCLAERGHLCEQCKYKEKGRQVW